MSQTPDYALLGEAFVIVDGIPENIVTLGPLVTSRGPALDDGTVCAPEGWLAQHPLFIEMGLSLSDDGAALRWRDKAGSIAEVMAKVFNIPEQEAAQIFGAREDLLKGEKSELTDKQLWEEGVRSYLRSKNDALKAQGSANAATSESTPAEADSPSISQPSALAA